MAARMTRTEARTIWPLLQSMVVSAGVSSADIGWSS